MPVRKRNAFGGWTIPKTLHEPSLLEQYFKIKSHPLVIFQHQNYDVAKIINDKGCLPAGEEWLERNLLVVAGVAVGIAFLQVRFHYYYL